MRWETEGKAVPHRHWSRFVTAGGIKWHVQDSGAPEGRPDAPVALLIHGTGASTHSFAGLAPLLAPHFRLIMPDLPGHGFTGKLRAPDPDHVARAFAALCTELGVAPDLIIGHSVGAAIAFTLVARGLLQPKAVVSLGGALLNFHGPGAKVMPGLARALFVNPFMPALMSWGTRFQSVPDLLARWTGSKLTREQEAHYERLLASASHTGGALALMAHWDLTTIEQTISDVKCPVLLVHGERDRTVPPETARTVASRLERHHGQPQLAPVPGLGHLAHEEAPDRHARVILDYARAQGVLGA
jgi:magnesium chelatase accessory protein